MRRQGIVAVCLGLGALLSLTAGAVYLASEPRIAGTVHATASGLEVPDLDDPAMIRRGAVHYDLVCAACHASPADPRRGTAVDLSPPAPALPTRVSDWPPSLLFRTVRDGVAGSAMPAWPAQDRPDEVWSVVAFLMAMPELSADDYADLAGREGSAWGDPPATAAGVGPTCARCHGTASATAPRLGIQHPDYLRDALHAYRSGARSSGFMQHLATRLQDSEIERLAIWLSEQETPAPVPTDGTDSDPDAPPEIITAGAPERQIAACNACHDPAGPARPDFPVLAGQHETYLATQLTLFSDDTPHPVVTRGGGPFVGLMQQAANGLTDEEIAELAAWFAAQP